MSHGVTLPFTVEAKDGPRPLVAAHIHAPGGEILFDLDTAEPRADGALEWAIVPAGTFDVEEILDALFGGGCYLNLHTAAYPSGEVLGFLRRASGSQAFVAPPDPPALAPGPPTEEDAARFLLATAAMIVASTVMTRV